MADSSFNHILFGVHADALSLRQERMQMIASNLANSDTPHYRARDIDFAGALQEATQGLSPAGMARTADAHLAAGDGLPARHLTYRASTQPSLDGNTVDTNAESASFARASLEYRASLGFVEDRIRTLLTAITGQS
jgi:flagellar basal-body rod protein FlgB